MVYYCRRWIPVYARPSYVSHEKSAILYLWVLQAIEDLFLSSYSFIFVAYISHAGFPSKCGLRRGVVLSQANISRSGPLMQVALH